MGRKAKIFLKEFCEKNREYSHLLEEWDEEKNMGVCMNETVVYSTQPVWWKCSEGHSWQARPNGRVGAKANCPFCLRNGARYRVVAGINDLATTHPAIAQEWHSEKNEITATEVSQGSTKKVWWRCLNCNHEWEAQVKARTRKDRPTKCAKCRKKTRTKKVA